MRTERCPVPSASPPFAPDPVARAVRDTRPTWRARGVLAGRLAVDPTPADAGLPADRRTLRANGD
ncbi:hypothetical protein ACFQ7A_08515 [Streptomyces sp. NPDC056528]|uniref:hypothetical protein n=1 Tax=Streptomyces sp. NPDC056528 TaxID=3345854 RepID=UPI0036AF857F